MQVNIYEAKTKLSALLEAAASGEPVIIARAGKPVARLVALADAPTSRSGVVAGGISAEELGLSDDFHEPMTDDDLLGS